MYIGSVVTTVAGGKGRSCHLNVLAIVSPIVIVVSPIIATKIIRVILLVVLTAAVDISCVVSPTPFFVIGLSRCNSFIFGRFGSSATSTSGTTASFYTTDNRHAKRCYRAHLFPVLDSQNRQNYAPNKQEEKNSAIFFLLIVPVVHRLLLLLGVLGCWCG